MCFASAEPGTTKNTKRAYQSKRCYLTMFKDPAYGVVDKNQCHPLTNLSILLPLRRKASCPLDSPKVGVRSGVNAISPLAGAVATTVGLATAVVPGVSGRGYFLGRPRPRLVAIVPGSMVEQLCRRFLLGNPRAS